MGSVHGNLLSSFCIIQTYKPKNGQRGKHNLPVGDHKTPFHGLYKPKIRIWFISANKLVQFQQSQLPKHYQLWNPISPSDSEDILGDKTKEEVRYCDNDFASWAVHIFYL